MHWEKEIRIRITLRRIVGTILAASTVANLIIVGAVYGADSVPPAPTETSATVTSLPTSTFSVPTSTAEATLASALTHIPGVTLTETSLVLPTDTPSITPTDTSTPTEMPMAVPGWPPCIKKFYWPIYRVKPGDTLFSLALATGSTVQKLLSANCLASSQIYSGQALYVPRPIANPVTSTVTATWTPTASPTATATHTATDTPTSTYTPTVTPSDTPSPTPTDSPTPPPTITVTFTAPPSVTPTDTYTVPLAQPEFQDLKGLTCVYPKFIVLAVAVYNTDGIRSVSALLYNKDNLLLAEIPMKPEGNSYVLTADLPDPYLVSEIDHYQYYVVDSLQNISFSPVYNQRSGGCYEPRGLHHQNGNSTGFILHEAS